MDQQLVLLIDDAIDAAAGSGGGVIVVRNAEERELAAAQLKAMALRAHVAGLEAKTTIMVTPGAAQPHWRPKPVFT